MADHGSRLQLNLGVEPVDENPLRIIVETPHPRLIRRSGKQKFAWDRQPRSVGTSMQLEGPKIVPIYGQTQFPLEKIVSKVLTFNWSRVIRWQMIDT